MSMLAVMRVQCLQHFVEPRNLSNLILSQMRIKPNKTFTQLGTNRQVIEGRIYHAVTAANLDHNLHDKGYVYAMFDEDDSDCLGDAILLSSDDYEIVSDSVMTRDDFLAYLKDTLIPDLCESGMHSTATDFLAAVNFIKGATNVDIDELSHEIF